MRLFLIILIYLVLLYMGTMVKNVMPDGTNSSYQSKEVSSDDILESLYKMRKRESDQPKTALTINQKLMTMVNEMHPKF